MVHYALWLLLLPGATRPDTAPPPQGARPDSCALLRRAAARLRQHATLAREQQFASAFPSAFPSFVHLFGYQQVLGKPAHYTFACLYGDSHSYLDQLFALRYVRRVALYPKLVRLAQHAAWQDDGVWDLQQHCRRLVEEEPAFLAFLNAQSPADIQAFTQLLLLDPRNEQPFRKRLHELYAPYRQLRPAA